MTIREAQQAVDHWIKTYGVRYFSELTNMACLTEEVGELARVMARRYGDQSFKAGEKQDQLKRWPTYCGCSWPWPIKRVSTSPRRYKKASKRKPNAMPQGIKKTLSCKAKREKEGKAIKPLV